MDGTVDGFVGGSVGARDPRQLMRDYCELYVNRQDMSRCQHLMVEDYEVHIAGTHIRGRSAYEPLAGPLFEIFPDLRIVLHEMIGFEDRFATRFTLRGSSTRRQGRPAQWGGVAIYRWDGERLTQVWVEEDHHLARAQLRGDLSTPDPVPAQQWDAAFRPPDPGVEETVRQWLAASDPMATVDALLTVGSRVAFHTSSPRVHVAGMATVAADGAVTNVLRCTDGGAGAP